jgi:hypothetical protein
MKVVNNHQTTQVKQVFARTKVTSAIALPLANASKAMFNSDTLAQLGTTCLGVLTLP